MTELGSLGLFHRMKRAVEFLALIFCFQGGFAQMADFRLTDVGLASARRNAVVSPRDYIMQVSGFYFGAAT